ncbi:hypothetical protein G6M26_47740 [Agrobacterium tumefaciens]|nr:hypothetical protein [Agrobacterium tumefaciens]NTE26237.1 hypothetical protein [Agrobacterium tumefaciens]
MKPVNNPLPKKALIIGELLADIISEKNIPSLASPATFSMNQGGSAANFCSNLKGLGIDATLIAAVGHDNLGVFLLNALKDSGISDQHIARLSKHQTSMVLVGKNTETPDFIAYRSADAHISKIDDQLIESADLLHTTAFSLSIEPARSNILAAFKKGNQLQKDISIDWNFAPSIWREDDGKAVFEAVCHLQPLLKISLDDLERFTGKSSNINEALSWLDSLSIKFICLTCGKDGVWFKEQKQPWQHQPALPVTAINGVTGAGDAFWSGFIAHYLKGKPTELCINYALEIARKKIEKL